MASPSLLRVSTRSDLYVCARCAFQASKASQKTTRRWIGTKYLAKVADAELQWQEQKLEIKAGKKKSMLTILEERGLINQTTGYGDLSALRSYYSMLTDFIGLVNLSTR